MCDAADMCIYILGFLTEVIHGVFPSAEGLLKLRENNTSGIPIGIATDSCAVFSALKPRDIKIPAEKNTILHLHWLHELVQRSIIKYLYWIDTRDMVADGLNKGCVNRQALRELSSQGKWILEHEFKSHTHTSHADP